MNWSPIETAPKDGTKIIVWDRVSGFIPWVYFDEGEWVSEFVLWSGQPTHWMPFAEPSE